MRGRSLPGPVGPAGTNGTNGTNGADGAPGAAGTNGTNGTNGADGAPGAAGTNGTNGADGASGAGGPGASESARDLGLPLGNVITPIVLIRSDISPLSSDGAEICSISLGAGVLLAGGRDSRNGIISKSTNYGATWTVKLATNAAQRSQCSALCNVGGGVVLGFVDGINGHWQYQSNDYGETWDTGIFKQAGDAYLMHNCIKAGDRLVKLGDTYARVLLHSADNGATWVPSTFTISGNATDSAGLIYLGGGIVLAAGVRDSGNQVLRSLNNGQSFTVVSSGNVDGLIARDFIDLGSGIVILVNCANWSVCGSRSTDYGATWTPLPLPSNVRPHGGCAVGGYAYISTEQGGLYVSKDKGSSWTDYGSFVPAGLTSVKTKLLNCGAGKILGTHLYSQAGHLDISKAIY